MAPSSPDSGHCIDKTTAEVKTWAVFNCRSNCCSFVDSRTSANEAVVKSIVSFHLAAAPALTPTNPSLMMGCGDERKMLLLLLLLLSAFVCHCCVKRRLLSVPLSAVSASVIVESNLDQSSSSQALSLIHI